MSLNIRWVSRSCSEGLRRRVSSNWLGSFGFGGCLAEFFRTSAAMRASSCFDIEHSWGEVMVLKILAPDRRRVEPLLQPFRRGAEELQGGGVDRAPEGEGAGEELAVRGPDELDMPRVPDPVRLPDPGAGDDIVPRHRGDLVVDLMP